VSIHINRTISDVFPVDGSEDSTQVETDDRLEQTTELRQFIRQTEAEQVRVAAWNFDD